MKLAETVTFGASTLDRAAELRSDPAQLARLARGPESRHLAFWRGKVLQTNDHSLMQLAFDDPLLTNSADVPVFVGRDGKAPIFAHDVSSWDPPEGLPDSLADFFDPSQQVVADHLEHPYFGELRGVMSDLTPLEAELAATAKAILGWHVSHRFCSKCGAPSQIADGGWRRDCEACGGQHFPRTDPVVIMLITHGNSVLLGRSPGWPDRMYSLLAGFVEPGETLEGAVRREVYEETSIPVGRVGYLAGQPWPFPSSLMFGCWGEATDTKITIDPNEIEDAIWVSREDMMDIFAGTHALVRAPRKGAIAGFLLEHWLRDRLD